MSELKLKDQINDHALSIYSCAKSMEFIQKDLEDLENYANMRSDGDFTGLINIVEQMTARILQETDKIMQLSDE